MIVTNPNAISEIEENKKNQLFTQLQQTIQSEHENEDEFNKEIDKMKYFFTYEWQDIREERANMLLNHYIKELDIKNKFNEGFVDAMTVGEEIYHCDIVGGEPTFNRANPMKVHVFKNGYSNRIEDADILVHIDFWSPGRIIDTFYDVLSQKDIEFIDNMPQAYFSDNMQNIDERNTFLNLADVGGLENGEGSIIDNWALFAQTSGASASTNYYDNNGNIRVLKVF